MADKTFKIIQLVGTSDDSFEAAVENAIAKAKETVRGLAWFEVTEQRGAVRDGNVEFQVKLNVAFRLGA